MQTTELTETKEIAAECSVEMLAGEIVNTESDGITWHNTCINTAHI